MFLPVEMNFPLDFYGDFLSSSLALTNKKNFPINYLIRFFHPLSRSMFFVCVFFRPTRLRFSCVSAECTCE